MTVSDAEASEAYDCAKPELTAAYAKSGIDWVGEYGNYKRYNTTPYVSATHGERYVNNYANVTAYDSYIQYDDLSEDVPAGARFAKDSFQIDDQGRVAKGPLFLMEKMEAGFNADSQDWKYTMIMPNGSIAGATNGPNSGAVEFCIGCHIAVQDNDSLFFLPEEYRVEN